MGGFFVLKWLINNKLNICYFIVKFKIKCLTFKHLSVSLKYINKQLKTKIIMKTYNYFYYGTPITKAQFEKEVPGNWKSEVNEFGEYSHGGYRAIERD